LPSAVTHPVEFILLTYVTQVSDSWKSAVIGDICFNSEK